MTKKSGKKEESESERMFRENERNLWYMFEQVTDNSFKMFLKDKGVDSLDCPICHSKGMGFPTIMIGGGEKFLAPIKTDELTSRYQLNPINFKYRAICSECGHELYFNASRVMKWLGFFENESGSGNE
ncbi:hypothetical protein ABN238_16710 [Providencia rettgeri]|uniref:hypothetical protein n=1 Tax=Providencia rettgeri TaxID=587 RepID=UPI0032D9B1CD